MNISCRPKSPFSWDFELKSAHQSADLDTKWFSEQGSLTFENRTLEITKQGPFSGEWHLLEDRKVIAHARKAHLFTRRFVLSFSNEEFLLQPTGLGRNMTLLSPKEEKLTISPVHPFSRRTHIQGEGADFLQASFAFWLTILTWRRASNAAAS